MLTALRRVQIFASDFPRSRRFYGETLGLSESGGFENDWVEFGLGPVLLKLTPIRPGEVPARNQVAAVFSTTSLDESLAGLKEKGVTVTRPPTEEFTGRSAEILDPDGYRIILFQPSELHPDEEWVPTSRVDEIVRHRLAARRQREKARTGRKSPARKAARKPTSAPRRKLRGRGAAKRKAASRKKPAPVRRSRKPGKR